MRRFRGEVFVMKRYTKTPGTVARAEGFQDSKTNSNALPNTSKPDAGLAPTARIEPTHYYCVSIYSKGKHHKLAVWNGMHEYESHPPMGLIAMMNNGESRTI